MSWHAAGPLHGSRRSVAPGGSRVTTRLGVRSVAARTLRPCRPCASRSPRSPPGSVPSRTTWRRTTSDRRGARARRGPGGVPGARPDRLPAPGPRVGGRHAPRRPGAAGAGRGHPGHVRGRVVRRGVGRPPAVHRGGAAGGRRDPPCPPQGLPAHVRPVRRAALLRAGRRHQRPAARARAHAGHLRVRGLLAPVVRRTCWRSTARRCSSTCRRRRGGTSRPSTRTAWAPRPRGARSTAPTRS